VLQTSEELRAYATYVAGTVGYMLTELFALRLGRRLASAERLRELALPFGLGLQFTNILQDLAEDRKRGWSYVPEEVARRYGTSARALDAPEERKAAMRVIADLVREAAGYLDRAMDYSLALPRRSPRLRLFCLWPTFFALRTLVRVLGEERILTGGEKIRISRREVRAIIGRTGAACLSDHWLRSLYVTERARLERRMTHEALIA
jgi:farnesyl-diphosphate farnesyltransferase